MDMDFFGNAGVRVHIASARFVDVDGEGLSAFLQVSVDFFLEDFLGIVKVFEDVLVTVLVVGGRWGQGGLFIYFSSSYSIEFTRI